MPTTAAIAFLFASFPSVQLCGVAFRNRLALENEEELRWELMKNWRKPLEPKVVINEMEENRCETYSSRCIIKYIPSHTSTLAVLVNYVNDLIDFQGLEELR